MAAKPMIERYQKVVGSIVSPFLSKGRNRSADLFPTESRKVLRSRKKLKYTNGSYRKSHRGL